MLLFFSVSQSSVSVYTYSLRANRSILRKATIPTRELEDNEQDHHLWIGWLP